VAAKVNDEPPILASDPRQLKSGVPISRSGKTRITDKLIERARNHVMTPAERREQRVSFVYGMLSHRDTRTKDDIRAELSRIHGWGDGGTQV
jgi:hypothetical protein